MKLSIFFLTIIFQAFIQEKASRRGKKSF